MYVPVTRAIAALLGLLMLVACAPPPHPFEHDDSEAPVRRLPRDKIEVAVGAPRNMPAGMGERVAAALNALGVSTRDMMSIFQAMKTAGTLQAELVLN